MIDLSAVIFKFTHAEGRTVTLSEGECLHMHTFSGLRL